VPGFFSSLFTIGISVCSFFNPKTWNSFLSKDPVSNHFYSFLVFPGPCLKY